MSFKLVFKEQAREDIADTFKWYELQIAGLGDQFLLALDLALKQISANPQLFQIRRKNVRLGLLRRFPYFVAYEIEGTQIIVYRIIHAKRNPQKRFRKK
jgi:plasmid stabilization system protein ParE